jgi:predicted small lipoprotein YifL
MLPSLAVPPRSVAALLLTLLALGACGDAGAPGPVHRPPADGELPEEAAFLAEIDRTRGERDCFTVIEDPVLVGADGAHGIAFDEIVMGVDLGTTQVAYPIQLLNFHEIVEHTVDGLDLLACW